MKFKDFEISPACFIDGHTDPKIWDAVKWQCHNPTEVTDLETGEKKDFHSFLLFCCANLVE